MSVVARMARVSAETIADRRARGIDGHDEVWDGVYVVSPMADLEHQTIVGELVTILNIVVGWPGRGRVFAGLNVSDRNQGWAKNYRVPDVAVFLKDGVGTLHRAHAEGGPDFLVEVMSDDDPAIEKLPFYAGNGVREVLFVRRGSEWALELYRLDGADLKPAERSTSDDPRFVRCEVVPLALRLVADPDGGRPGIEAVQTDGDLRRLI